VTRLILVLAVVGGMTVPARGQTAKQGDPGHPADQTVFTSPMVLETAFAASDRSLWKRRDLREGGRDWFTVPEYQQLGKFRCDGVSLRGDTDRKHEWDSGLYMSARELPDGGVDVGIWAKVFNPRQNHDKLVTLFLEVVNGETVSAKVAMPPIKVRDRAEPEDGKASLLLPASALLPTTKLRITVTTQNY
jgi:hypothetical protein